MDSKKDGDLIMSKPIAETPVLTGKDAKIFEQKIKWNEKHPLPEKEYMRIMKTYRKIKRSK